MSNSRSHQPEWMDLGSAYYTAKEYQDCLYQLDRIGRFLGGDQATFWALKQLPSIPKSILDVGCGGGLFTLRLAKSYRETQIIGTDISQEAIAFAQKHLKQSQPLLTNVQFKALDSPELPKNSPQFDVVMATLVCHHLSDQQLVSFIKKACDTAKKAVILNDLHRHSLATLGFATLAPFFFRNRMIWHDGLLSIRRAFTRQDWQDFLAAAHVEQQHYSLTWHWAFRWIVMIDITKMKRKV